MIKDHYIHLLVIAVIVLMYIVAYNSFADEIFKQPVNRDMMIDIIK